MGPTRVLLPYKKTRRKYKNHAVWGISIAKRPDDAAAELLQTLHDVSEMPDENAPILPNAERPEPV